MGVAQPLPTIRTWGTKHGLPLAMGAMAALGTFLLGLGQSSLLLPTVALFASVTSVYFTDIKGWFRLHRALANLAALIAVGYSLIDFFSVDFEGRLLSVANLLVYLQIVLLYQEKNDRVYWQLIMLSLLQVVVASALSLGFQFGVLLVVYLFTALATMTLFVMARESERFLRVGPEPPRPRKSGALKLRGAPQPLTENLRSTAERWSSFRLLRQVFALGLWTLLATVVFFFSLPRTGDSVWLGPGAARIRQSGFNSRGVNLDEISRIRQNTTPVLRVSFREPTSGAAFRVQGEFYLRGMAITEYENGRWRAGRFVSRPDQDAALHQPRAGDQLVRQEIILEPTEEATLFSTFPAYRVSGTPNDVFFNPLWQQMFCGDEGPPLIMKQPPLQFHYALGVTAFRNNEQRPIVPHNSRASAWELGALRRDDDFLLTRLPRNPETKASLVPGLAQVAAKVIADAKLENANSYQKAKALEAHFFSPGLYTYALESLEMARNADLDPIEDFVTNHRTGHCEFFASALVLMCRSQGVPARLALGYKGGELNSVGSYYTVRQSHAHAWVEVLLKPDEIPEGALLPHEKNAYGAWLRLDPTPASGDDELAGLTAGPLARIGELVDYAQTMWTEYVLGLNSERQERSIYQPLRERVTELVQSTFNGEAWTGFWERTAVSLGLYDDTHGVWFNWRIGLAVFFVALLLVMVFRAVWALVVIIRSFLARRAQVAGAKNRPSVPFYARLEALLAQHGLRRTAGQTQREFAAAVGRHLSATPASAAAADVPPLVVEAFYRTRFGARPLDSGELSQLDSALGRLQLVLTSAVHAGNVS